MKTSLRWLAMLAMVTGAGCDGGGGGGGGLAIEDVPANSASVICDTVFGCLGPYGSLFGTEPACLTLYEQGITNGDYQRWQAVIAAGTATYDAEAAQRCADATSATGCQLLQSGTAAECADVWTGTRALGATCSMDIECVGEAYCNGADCPGTPGVCTMRSPGGGSCNSNNECETGLACEGRTCVVPTGHSGGACDSQDECPLDEQCVGATDTASGLCRDRASLMTAALGEPCQLQGEMVILCQAGGSCAVTGFELPMSAVFECLAPVATGASCNAAVPEMCPENQYCEGANPFMLAFDGTCAPLPGAGADCATTLFGERCLAGLACVDGRCVQPQANGGACAGDGECYSGRCRGGACVAPELCTL